MKLPGQILLGLLLTAGAAAVEELDVFVVQAPPKEDLALMSSERAADVTVISRDMIEKSGAFSVPDLLRSEANVLMRSSTGNVNDGQISMRGFGENSQLRTLILVDGHKMNRPDMGVASWQSIPLNSVERIEVIRGGQNVLYGDHALAGVVTITTKQGRDAGTQVKGMIGSDDFIAGYLGHGDSAGPVEYFLSIDGYESGGFRSNSLSRAATVSAGLTWNADVTDTVSFRASHTDAYQQYAGPLSYEDMQEDPTQSNYAGSDGEDGQYTQASLIWKTMKSWGEARISSGYNRREKDGQLQGIYAANVQHGFSLGPRIKFGGADDFLIAGIDAFYDTLDQENYHPNDQRYTISEGAFERMTMQPYAFAQYRFSGDWFLGGGARYEYASTDNYFQDYVDNQVVPYIDTNRGPIPNPNYKNPADIISSNSYDGVINKQGWAGTVSLTKEINRRWSGFVRYDRVYRYPVLDEAAAYQEYPLSDPLNEALEPETGDHYSAGLKYLTRQWRFQWSAFALLMDNEIQFVDDGVTQLNQNIGETRRLGTAVEAALDKYWYGVSTRWSLQDASFAGGENEGNAVPLAPPLYGVFAVWLHPVDALRLTLNWSYVSEQYQGNDHANTLRKMDAYGLLGLHAEIMMSDAVKLSIAIDNLLDETYASTAYSGSFYPGAGRQFRCGLTVEF